MRKFIISKTVNLLSVTVLLFTGQLYAITGQSNDGTGGHTIQDIETSGAMLEAFGNLTYDGIMPPTTANLSKHGLACDDGTSSGASGDQQCHFWFEGAFIVRQNLGNTNSSALSITAVSVTSTDSDSGQTSDLTDGGVIVFQYDAVTAMALADNTVTDAENADVAGYKSNGVAVNWSGIESTATSAALGASHTGIAGPEDSDNAPVSSTNGCRFITKNTEVDGILASADPLTVTDTSHATYKTYDPDTLNTADESATNDGIPVFIVRIISNEFDRSAIDGAYAFTITYTENLFNNGTAQDADAGCTADAA